MIDLSNKTIVISRTDSIGDVILTLPITTWLKDNFENIRIVFLGRNYTKPVIESYSDVDEFLSWDELLELPLALRKERFRSYAFDAIVHVFPNKEIASLARSAKIPVRVGTSHRAYHLLTCNHRINFTRKRSDLHEAQLNFNLIKPFGLMQIPSIEQIEQMVKVFHAPKIELPKKLSDLKGCTILHPGSQGSAVEWPIEKYVALSERLAEKGEKVVFTGTRKEGGAFRSYIPQHENIHDLTGEMDLYQLIKFIDEAKNLVACSTGPLHISGYLGTNTIGLFSARRPIHPGRWKALGSNVHILVNNDCEKCSKGEQCDCIQSISVERVLEKLK